MSNQANVQAQPLNLVPMNDEDRLMSRPEAAVYLSVAVQTLAVWATTGRYQLPYYKIGSKVRYKKSDLDAFLERRRMGLVC